MKKILAAVMMVFVLSGCASVSEKFETRVTCTVAKDEARADSKWGLFGISTKVSKADSKVICQ